MRDDPQTHIQTPAPGRCGRHCAVTVADERTECERRPTDDPQTHRQIQTNRGRGLTGTEAVWRQKTDSYRQRGVGTMHIRCNRGEGRISTNILGNREDGEYIEDA